MKSMNIWKDLPLRIVSASLLLMTSGLCIYFGDPVFTFFVIMIVGIVHWELGKMLTPTSNQAQWFSAVCSAISLFVIILVNNILFVSGVLFINFLFQRKFFHHSKNFGAVYSFAVIICGVIFHSVRLDFGLHHIIWLIGVVVLTDTAGYLTGRIFGGPKVFSRVSPNKTWSGVFGGWLAAGIFSLFFVKNVATPDLFVTFVAVSILLSLAAQVGDMIQSYLKRISQVKDSSNLIPGHGGFMDRFDGFIGATVVTGFFFEWII